MKKPPLKQSLALTCLSLVLVFAYTLFPFDFAFKETLDNLDKHFYLLGWGISSILDRCLNILLFLPLGVGLTALLKAKSRPSETATIAIIFISGFFLSYSIEILQIFHPGRFPSLIDVVTNVTGCLTGYIIFRFNIVGYFLLMLIISVLMQTNSTMNNWDSNLPLLAGNELTGDRPWIGSIKEASFSNRAVSSKEAGMILSGESTLKSTENTLLGSYIFQGKGPYLDTTGNLPDLAWTSDKDVETIHDAAYVNAARWLNTDWPVTSLSERIVKTGQFTISLKASSGKLPQYGPARILSLSASPMYRNFTLGQEKSDLVFRLRTPLTGENGTPGVVVKNVFSTNTMRHLIITYDGALITIYVDSINNAYEFEVSPGASAFRYIHPINSAHLRIYKLVWYIIIFMPSGILLAMNRKVAKMPVALLILWIAAPSVILEGALMITSGRHFILENVVAGTILMAIPASLSTLTTRKMT